MEETFEEQIKTKFVCMEHLDELQMTEGKYNFYLLCPKYYYENRGTKKACTNRISLAASRMINDDILLLSSEDNLTEGYECETMRHVYKIISIKNNEVIVGIKTKEGGKRKNASYFH